MRQHTYWCQCLPSLLICAAGPRTQKFTAKNFEHIL